MLEKITKEMIEYYNKDVRRINHALKVYSFCRAICSLEQLSEKEQLIVNLLMRFYDVNSGNIYIDDKNMKDVTNYNMKMYSRISRQKKINMVVCTLN